MGNSFIRIFQNRIRWIEKNFNGFIDIKDLKTFELSSFKRL